MVQVNLLTSSWGYTRMTAVGHAEDSRVCAAVSAIMWGLAGMMLNVKDKPQINSLVLQSGNFDVDITPSVLHNGQEIVDTCFKFALIALSQIQRQHPNEIEIVTR